MYASYNYISLGLVKNRVSQRKQPSKIGTRGKAMC